jgi:glutamyl-tRNA synthetase
MTVRLRFAPSPTGYLHIGNARSALFTWLYTRRYDGDLVLRVEDTDLKRTKEGTIELFMESLRWLGVNWDEGPEKGGPYGPYIQTQRAELYQEWAQWLLEKDQAYKCFCTSEELAERRQKAQAARETWSGYDRRCRHLSPDEISRREEEGVGFAIRFKMPREGTTTVPDLIRGDIVVENNLVPDYVILKSNGIPTYHLAHPVDDHYMEITHVTRGVEWLSTAPLHVNIFRALGWEMPIYVHLPLIMNPSGRGKLSKRKQAFEDAGQEVLVQVEEFRDAGYLPAALANFLDNVGWSFGEDREKFTLEEAIPRFDLADVNPAETRLPYEKLDWLNGLYIQEMESYELAEALKPFLENAGYEVDVASLAMVTPSLGIRLKKLTDAIPLLRFLYCEDPLELTVGDLTDKKLDQEAARRAFGQARDFVANLDPFELEAVGPGLLRIGETNTANGKAGPFLGRMRYAVTGQRVSPPLFESMMDMGRDEVLARIDHALEVLNAA